MDGKYIGADGKIIEVTGKICLMLKFKEINDKIINKRSGVYDNKEKENRKEIHVQRDIK